MLWECPKFYLPESTPPRDRGKYLKVGGQTMGSAEREPITGVWGRSPQWGLGESPWSEGQGAKPPEAETLLAFGLSMEVANLPNFLKSRNTENQTFVLSRQCGHNTIPSYFYTLSSHTGGMEHCPPEVNSFLTRYSYAVVSGVHYASVVRPFVCGSRLYCG